jgi:hypothetical protein
MARFAVVNGHSTVPTVSYNDIARQQVHSHIRRPLQQTSNLNVFAEPKPAFWGGGARVPFLLAGTCSNDSTYFGIDVNRIYYFYPICIVNM